MVQFHIDRLFQADAEKVWDFLMDFEARKSEKMQVRIIEPGDPGKNKVGLLREIQMNGKSIREKILSVTPKESIEYQLIEGAPVHDYFGTVFVYPERIGTTVRWVATFKTKFPWPEWLVKKSAMKFIESIMDDMEKSINS